MHPPLPPNNPRTPLYVLSRRTGCRVITYSGPFASLGVCVFAFSATGSAHTSRIAQTSAVLYDDCCFAIENTGEAVATEMYGSLHAKLLSLSQVAEICATCRL